MSNNATLVERLRERSASYMMGGPSSAHTSTMLDEAAARIAELEGEVAHLRRPGNAPERYWEARWRDEKAAVDRLRAALSEIANSGARQHDFAIPADHVTWAIWQSRAALSGEGVTK